MTQLFWKAFCKKMFSASVGEFKHLAFLIYHLSYNRPQRYHHRHHNSHYYHDRFLRNKNVGKFKKSDLSFASECAHSLDGTARMGSRLYTWRWQGGFGRWKLRWKAWEQHGPLWNIVIRNAQAPSKIRHRASSTREECPSTMTTKHKTAGKTHLNHEPR